MEGSKSERNPMLARRRRRQTPIYVSKYNFAVIFQCFFMIIENFLSIFPKIPGNFRETSWPQDNYPEISG